MNFRSHGQRPSSISDIGQFPILHFCLAFHLLDPLIFSSFHLLDPLLKAYSLHWIFALCYFAQIPLTSFCPSKFLLRSDFLVCSKVASMANNSDCLNFGVLHLREHCHQSLPLFQASSRCVSLCLLSHATKICMSYFLS